MKPDLPIACTLTSDEFRSGRQTLLPGIIGRADGHERIDDGFRFRFASGEGLLTAIAAMIDAERRCCRFLRFQMTAEPDEGAISLEVTGPPGTEAFLAAWLPPS